jgi:hypothetical protein
MRGTNESFGRAGRLRPAAQHAILPAVMPQRRLSPVQRKVVSAIRRLDAEREPLNITAVKRRHPELIRNAFSVRPFWGWKRALEAAGANYRTIRIAIDDAAECRICHRRCSILTSHLRGIHGISPEEYLADYPGAEVMCESLRAQRLGLNPRTRARVRMLMPHWEPMWSPEYVLDRIAEYQKRGYPMNMEALGSKDKGLYGAAQKYFLSWDDALRAAGLDPAEVRRAFPCPYSSKRRVIAAIRSRVRLGLPVHISGLTQGSARDCPLVYAAIGQYGSFRAAVEAADMDYAVIDRRRAPRCPPGEPLARPWSRLTREHVLKAIWQRAEAGLPMNSTALLLGPHADRRLFRATRRFFGTWATGAIAAGVERSQIQRPSQRLYPTPEEVISGISRRRQEGKRLNAITLFKKGPEQDRALYMAGRHFFGSWRGALEAGGVDYAKVFRK